MDLKRGNPLSSSDHKDDLTFMEYEAARKYIAKVKNNDMSRYKIRRNYYTWKKS